MSPEKIPNFTCTSCGDQFSLPEAVLARYPGWTPRLCTRCRGSSRGARGTPGTSGRNKSPAAKRGSSRPQQRGSSTLELNLPLAEVLGRFSGGPQDGVFTDGACSGNPGPGGWGAVHVVSNEVVTQQYGHDPQTTNNRMELTALIAGYDMLPPDAEVVIYSDSELCVKTINEWAAAWEARGWRRKTGEVKNLDLVQRAWALAQTHPRVRLRWIKAHDGSRWNEYADSLATAYLRDTL